MHRCRSLIFVFALLVACQARAQADPDPGLDPSIAIKVSNSGNLIIVDATILVPATPHEAWEVLTDYDHMVKFLHNLQYSKIVDGTKNKFKVAQKGQATYGPFSFSFDTVREVELTPVQEIRSHVISGSVKQGDGTTTLAQEGSGTRIVYHNETMSNYWLPPGLGPILVSREIRAQFENMKTEILRRKLERQRSQQQVGNIFLPDPDQHRRCCIN